MRSMFQITVTVLALVLPCAQAQVSTTVVISPIPGNPQASANQIVAALAAITDNSSAKPYLIKIEPGVYDFADQSLVMKPFIDVEGSGRSVTFLIADGRDTLFSGTVIGADDATLREVTVESRGNGTETHAVGVYLAGVDTRIHDVAVRSTYATLGSDGIYMRGGAPHISRTEIEVRGSLTPSGVAIESDSAAVLDDVEVDVRNGSLSNRAVLVQLLGPVRLRIKNCRLASHGGSQSWGIELRNNAGTEVEIDGVVIRATQATGTNAAIYGWSGERIEVSHSSLLASGGTDSYGVYMYPSQSGRLKADHCFISGTTATVDFHGSTNGLVGGSKLFGGAVQGNVTCGGVWDENYSFYPNTCP